MQRLNWELKWYEGASESHLIINVNVLKVMAAAAILLYLLTIICLKMHFKLLAEIKRKSFKCLENFNFWTRNNVMTLLLAFTVQWQIFFSLSNTNINWNGAYSSKDILIQICIHLISTEIWNPSKGWRKIEEGRLGKQWVTDQMRRMDINDKTFVVVSISSGPCQTCGHFPHLKSLAPLWGHK